MRVIRQIETGLLAQRGHLFGSVPVCLGIGIGVYFAIGQEPDIIQLATLGLGCLCVLVLSRLGPAAISPLLIGLALIGVGFGLAKTRTTIKEAPVLGFRYYGPIEGRIVNIDRSGSDAVRLTLDRVNLDRMRPAKTPAVVRVSLHGDWPSAPIRPGDMVTTTGHLSPPSGPAEAGGFDFQRHSWFLQVGAGYLALSGGNVATERAYIMVAVMWLAVLLDRRALTLRAVAIAAIIVLVIQPEALIVPGFQMSFAATTALVIVFGQMRRLNLQRLPKWTQPILFVIISSAVAGLATALFAAAHFNQIALYGLIANILSVPLMGILVVPAMVLAVCLAPFGLWSVGLWTAAAGLQWMLAVAGQVAGMEGALSHVIAPHWIVLPLIGFGLLHMALWQGAMRWAGVAVFGTAIVIWMQTERPSVLIADNGALIRVLGQDGRALSRAKCSGFVASIWLENYGNPVDQARAAARRDFAKEGRITRFAIGDW